VQLLADVKRQSPDTDQKNGDREECDPGLERAPREEVQFHMV